MGRILLALVLVLSVSPVFAGYFDALKAKRQVVKEFEKGEIGEQTQRAINNLVARGVFELREQGFELQAEQLEVKHTAFSTYLIDIRPDGLGDHEPLSRHLDEMYELLVEYLGIQVVEFLHLDDIKIFNYAIPVVFHPCGWHDDMWDGPEYKLHFVPFSGATVYWVAYLACSGATYGAGATGFACGPVALVLRKGTELYIAPPLSDKVYEKTTEKCN